MTSSQAIALLSLLCIILPFHASAWIAGASTGYAISSSLTVNGTVSVINNAVVTDLLASILQLQAQLTKTPTVQTFSTPGSGNYITPSPSPLYIRVRLVGGGGGGSGSGTAGVDDLGGSSTSGVAGQGTTFGMLIASGGRGAYLASGGGVGGAGGNASVGSGAFGMAWAGSSGGGSGAQTASVINLIGGMGGCSPFGGAGSSSYDGGPVAGTPNSGSGGGGGQAGAFSGLLGGGGGGAGGFVDAIVTQPSMAYPFTVGGGGNGGAIGQGDVDPGAAGGSGIIIVEELYH